MVNYKLTNAGVSGLVAVLFIILQVIANEIEPISYEEFLEGYEDAIRWAMEVDDFQVSELPLEVQYFVLDLYEDEILEYYPTITKYELTKMLAKDIKSRKKYYEQNKTMFKAFILKVLGTEIANKPGGEDKAFLSSMIMDTVMEIMRETIKTHKPRLDKSWKLFNMKDAFRTVYFYCKYPEKVAPFLTEEMRVEVKEWIDSTATWEKSENDSKLKLEL